MNELDFAYIAGYIDGDGCFYIDTVKAKTGIFPVVHRTILKFASVDESIMIWIKEFIGINYWKKVVCKKLQHIQRRDVFEANLTGEGLDIFLNRIYPYLRIKKKHCEIMINMRKTYCKPVKGVIRAQLTKETFDLRCKYHKELSSINTHKLPYLSAVSPST